jgi:hypothetical protein
MFAPPQHNKTRRAALQAKATATSNKQQGLLSGC